VPLCPRISTVSANWASYRMALPSIGREDGLGHLPRLGSGRPDLGSAPCPRDRCAHRRLEALRLRPHAHVLEHERGGENRRGGIGDALARDVAGAEPCTDSK